MLLERLGLHQCQGKYGQPVRPTGRIPFEGAYVIVPPIAKHPCTYRHRWNSSPYSRPLRQKKWPCIRSFHGHPLAENVTTLGSALPVCQGGHSAQSLKSITILDRTSVTPVSSINGVAGGVSGCKWKQQCSPINFHHIEKLWKRRFHAEAMLPTFTPRKLLGIGRDWKNGWMLNVRCLMHTLRWAPLNHVVCIRCLWWSWEWTRVVGSRTPRKACKQYLLPRNVGRNPVGSHTFVGLSVVGQLGW